MKWFRKNTVILTFPSYALALALAFGCIIVYPGFLSLAENRTKVEQIDLDISYEVYAGDSDVSFSASTSTEGVTVSSYEIMNLPEEYWRSGDVPRIKIYLDADSSHYFSSKGKSIFSFTGDKVTYSSAAIKEERSQLALTVKLEEVESTIGDLTPTYLEWDEATGVANWNDMPGAHHYQIKLFRGSSFIGSTIQTYEPSYNFASKLNRAGKYTFQVRGVDDKKQTGNWAESDVLEITKETLHYYTGVEDTKDHVTDAGIYRPGNTAGGPGTVNSRWEQDSLGWRYRRADGSYSIGCWEFINGKWYCFNNASYMQGGWIWSNGKWYYCDWATGAMLVNTVTPDGYKVGMDGVLIP